MGCVVELNEILSNECCVCLDNVDCKKDVRMKCCTQIMHKSCFLEWTTNKPENVNKCLVCKSEFQNVLEYVTFEDVLKYADKHVKIKTLNILSYALSRVSQCENVKIFIRPGGPSSTSDDGNEDNARTGHQTRMANWRVLTSKLANLVISVFIILLLLIAILSHTEECPNSPS